MARQSNDRNGGDSIMTDDPETPKFGEEEESQPAGRRRKRKAMTEEEQASESPDDQGSRHAEAEEKPSHSSRPRASNLRHTQRGRFTVDGPSGTPYTFGSHGTLKVKGEDVEALLAIKRVQRSCCGPRAPQVLYPLVRA